MARRRVQKSISKIPEPTMFRMLGFKFSSIDLADYMDSVIRSLRLKFEAVEAQLDAQDNKDGVVFIENETEVTVTFENFIYIIDATSGTVTLELPDALDAFNEKVTYKIREISMINQIDILPQSGQLIEGSIVFTIDGTLIKAVEIASNGKNWYILNTYN
jgi:hypothetical protein